MKKISLKTATCTSEIYCGKGVFDKFVPDLDGKQLFVVTDSNVFALYGDLLNKTFKSGYESVILPAGEGSKKAGNLLLILKKMLACGMRRNCTVLAFGGGVVGDIAGLAASLYMRGVRLWQIPTTLLAQVDSSVGGKTAVDMDGVKNAIGAFYQPETVIVDPRFLQTLPPREFRCGLGEIIKYAALDAGIYSKITSVKNLCEPRFLEEIISDCIAHKVRVVKSDERDENGARKTLNLGHTTGHAFELYYGRKSHGEYVLIGTYYELYIAQNLGICGGQYAESLKVLILSVLKKVPAFSDIEKSALYALKDKKNDDEKVSLIVPETEGKCREVKLSFEEYSRYLKQCSDLLSGGRL